MQAGLTAPDPKREPEAFLRHLFRVVVASADPAVVLARHLPNPPEGRTVVVGAGKAAAAMARALEVAWPQPLSGLVVTRYGHALPTHAIEVAEAAHPVPDAAGLDAARRVLASVQGLGEGDLVICLLSGGGSALLPLPAPGLTLADKQGISTALLRSGASIAEINCVRRHLSAIKGGRLAAACHPARVVTLAISDVPGDDPCDIASGPTVADPTRSAEAAAVLERYGIVPPPAVAAWLDAPASETVKPGDPRLARTEFRLIATPAMALAAAAEAVRAAGLAAYVLGDAIEGEAREVGRVLAALALQAAHGGGAFEAPCVLLSGGETTVTVRGNGRGGRNVELLLAMAIALRSAGGIHALAADTDGIDGVEEVAGAVIGPDTLARAARLGLDARGRLDDNDAHAFFARLGAQVLTGPTHTNVNDFRATLVV